MQRPGSCPRSTGAARPVEPVDPVRLPRKPGLVRVAVPGGRIGGVAAQGQQQLAQQLVHAQGDDRHLADHPEGAPERQVAAPGPVRCKS